MIQIDGLTHEQVMMLEFMWSLETIDEYLEWYETLDDNEQNMADTLQRMVILAELDNFVEVSDMSEARAVLSRF